MFDTPDIIPLCYALFVALIVGIIFYFVGLLIKRIIEKRNGKILIWWKLAFLYVLLAIVLPLSCRASILLRIGTENPIPWFKISVDNVIGNWTIADDTIEGIKIFKPTNDIPTNNELVFLRDGSFRIDNTNIITEEKDRITSGSGTWELKYTDWGEDKEWIVFAKFEVINGKIENKLMRFSFERTFTPIFTIYY